MSKDMLGPLTRALVGVPRKYLGTVLAVANWLGRNNVAEVEEFARDLKLFLRREPCLPKWRLENGVIYFPVTSDGTTGEEWILRLENKGVSVADDAKDLLRSPDFKPTNGITTEIAVLPALLFTDNDRITKKIRAYAEAFRTPNERKLITPSIEVACLIREKFTDEEIRAMGLIWIITIHRLVNGSDSNPDLLGAIRDGSDSWLGVCYVDPGHRWLRGGGFAFEVSSTPAPSQAA